MSNHDDEIINKYSDLIDSHSLITKSNANGDLTYVNDRFCKVTGYSREELLGSNHNILSSGHHSPEFFQKLWQTITSGKNWRANIKNKKKNGDFFWVDTSIHPVKDKNGNIIEFLSIKTEITNHKETQSISSSIQSDAHIGGWELDPKTGNVKWTDETYKIHEIPIGTPMNKIEGISYYAPHERTRIANYVNECVKNAVHYNDTFEFITEKGKKLWVRAIGHPVTDEAGNVIKVYGTFQDITEQKKQEIELEEKTKKLTTFYDSSPDLICIAGNDGYFKELNPSWTRVLGYSEEELLSKPFLDFVHPDDIEKTLNEVAKLSCGEKTLSFGNRYKTKKGDYIHLSWVATPDEERGVIYAIAHDISKIKAKEDELLEKTSYLDLALSGAQLGVWDWYLVDNSVKFDARWASMLGLDINNIEMSLETWESRVHPDDLERCYADIKAYMNGQTDSYENIHRMKHTDGHWVYILDKGKFSEFDEKGNPIRFTGTHLDITSSERSRRKLNLFFEKSTYGYAFCDMDGNLLEVNKKYEDITGYNFEELKKLSYWDITPKRYEAQEEEQLRSLRKKGSYGPYKKEYIRKNGKLIPVELNGFMVTDYGGVDGIWSVVEDISHKQELESQLLHSQRLATIGELAAGVGHEINNPLAIIMGYNDKLLEDLKCKGNISPENLNKYLTKIQKASERIEKIVQGLRTFSRSDSNNISQFDPIEALTDSINMIYEIYSKEGITITLKNSIDEGAFHVSGNIGRIQQVFMNMLSNAKDALSDSKSKSIEVSTNIAGELLTIKFKDSGCGIPEEIKHKIFDPFFTTKEVNEGTGIGLSLVHTIIKEHNGNIYVDSQLNSGTEFSIELPIIQTNETSFTGSSADEPQQQGLQSLELTALVVDDEEGLRDILSQLLIDLGLQVETAENGQEALDTISSAPNRFDLIVSDMQMPVLNGPDFLKKLRENTSIQQPKFIFTTGGITTDFEQSNLSQLIDGYFFKPFTQDSVQEALLSVFFAPLSPQKAS